MSPSARVAVCLAALFPARIAFAGDHGNIKVDVVVDVTDAGEKVQRPTPDHPAYFYPVTRGYTLGQGRVAGEAPPPPTVEVQYLMAKALAQQGYLVATQQPPSLVLIFWWGYKAPIFAGPAENQAPSKIGSPSSGAITAYSTVTQATPTEQFPADLPVNNDEMEELVFGSRYEPDTLQNIPDLHSETLAKESKISRYYLMVSALDFKSATQKKPVVLWTARISTPLWNRTLDQVLPALITSGSPLFGRDSDGPHIVTAPVVPMGHVIAGASGPKNYMGANSIPVTRAGTPIQEVPQFVEVMTNK